MKTIDADGAGSGTAVEEIYIYDGLREERGNAGDHILLAFDESDALTHRYLHGPEVDQVLASEEVTSTSAAGDVLWALTDHLGTVRDLVDYDAGTDTASVVNHIKYDAFGNITAESNAVVDFLFGFTGRERDEESDLQYNRARYYDSVVGKWIGEDPIGFRGGDENLGRYVGNRPTDGADPSGNYGPWGGTVEYTPTGPVAAPKPASKPASKPPVIGGALPPGSGGFLDSVGNSLGSMNDTYTALILEYWYGDPCAAQEFMDRAYERGPLGQSKDGPAWSYYGTRGALTVSSVSATAAGGVIIFEAAGGSTMSVTWVKHPQASASHFAFQVGKQWYHGVPAGNAFKVFKWGSEKAGQYGAGGYWNTLTGIPIRFPSAAASTHGTTANCATAAGRAIYRGWSGGGSPLLVLPFMSEQDEFPRSEPGESE